MPIVQNKKEHVPVPVKRISLKPKIDQKTERPQEILPLAPKPIKPIVTEEEEEETTKPTLDTHYKFPEEDVYKN